MDFSMFGKLLGILQGKQGGEETKEEISKVAGEFQNKSDEDQNNPKIKEIFDNPLEAIEKNEKLRNAVLAQQKQMGWNILPATSEYGMKDNSTDLGIIKLNHKIRISPLGNETVNILMFGKSGCGQTTLLSYLTKSNELKGADSMSTQQFHAETIDMQSKAGMTKVRFYESPGMCSGFEIPQLEEHWNRLIGTLNDQGGVSIFLLLIKSNERIISQFIDELEEFSELYFEDKEEFWKRTVVVFTTIDELNGCSTFEERVDKLESQIAKRGMEKVKRIIDQTGNKCLYVSCIDKADKQRLINDLRDRINSIYPKDKQILHDESVLADKTPQLNDLEKVNNIRKPNVALNSEDEMAIVSKPQHMIQGTQFGIENSILSETYPSNSKQCFIVSEIADKPLHASTICEPISVYQTENFSHSASNFEFLQQLSREQLLTLLQEMCKDKKFLKDCRKTHSSLFPGDSMSSSTMVKRRKRDRKWYRWN